MKVWLDDVRVPTLDWVWCKRLTTAIPLLSEKADEIDFLSLDHDLGEHEIVIARKIMGETVTTEVEENGYVLTCWMAEHDLWPAGDIYLHSENPIGRAAMSDMILLGPYKEALDGRTFIRV